MALTLYTTAGNARAFKAKIAALYAGVEIKEVIIKMGEGNKTPEFLADFPLGKVPVARTACGFPLSESGAIARHVARINPSAGLFGNSFYQGSLVDQWIDFGTLELEAGFPKWLWMVRGYFPYNEETFKQGKEQVGKTLKQLDNHLVSNTFITGDTITLADISVWSQVYALFTNVITQATAEKEWPSVTRWYNTLAIQPQFKAVVPESSFTKVEQFPAGHPQYVAPGAAPAAAKEEKKAAAPAPEPVKAAEPEPKKGGKGAAKAEAKKAAEPVKTPSPEPKVEAAPPASPEPKKGGKAKAEAKKAEPTPASPKVEAKKAPEPKAEAKKETPKKAPEPKAAEPKAEAPKASPKQAAQPKGKQSGKKK